MIWPTTLAPVSVRTRLNGPAAGACVDVWDGWRLAGTTSSLLMEMMATLLEMLRLGTQPVYTKDTLETAAHQR